MVLSRLGSEPNWRFGALLWRLVTTKTQIITELGELVTTLENTSGAGDLNWNLTTDSNQLIVSGIYIAVIKDNDTGDMIRRKFVVIR